MVAGNIGSGISTKLLLLDLGPGLQVFEFVTTLSLVTPKP